IGQRAWRTFHYVTFLVFVGVTVHGIAAGSDSNAPWAEAIYLGSSTLVLFLLMYRIAMSVAARASARVVPGPAGARPGGPSLPVREDAPRPRPATGSAATSVRDGGPLRRNPANPVG
ncbi:MAG: hypothetical protein QG587_147, partial [Chloroflexota bacterium]|nr:hypothetical protein [Chloroflexota bacterium]